MSGSAANAWAAAAAVDPDKVTPGLLGFLVVLGLGLATWVLLRSMNRQLKRVDFDDGSAHPDRPAPAGESDDDDPASPVTHPDLRDPPQS